MDKEVMVWINTAGTDLGVAKHLFENYYPKPLEIICYHCQQAAEKAVKSVIVFFGTQGGIPKKHDISFLMNQLKNMIEIDDVLYDYADTLTPYGVSVRYPNELFLEERHADQAIKYADAILTWAKEIIKEN